jgi:hypothetical protein
MLLEGRIDLLRQIQTPPLPQKKKKSIGPSTVCFQSGSIDVDPVRANAEGLRILKA